MSPVGRLASGAHDGVKAGQEYFRNHCRAPTTPDDELGEESSGGASDGSDADAPSDPVEAMLAELLTYDQLQDLPNPRPLINGLLDLDSESWIIGQKESYKSFVVLDMAGCVAAGIPWQGMRVTQGPVIYIVGEGMAGMKLRTRAWSVARQAKMTGVSFLPRPVQAKDGDWGTLVKVCRRLKPVLIIIDTQARCTVGLKENAAEDTNKFINFWTS
jgi:AAA domain-containing protein